MAEISRADAKVLQPDQKIVNEIIEGVVKGSSILPLMRKLPNMNTKQARLNVLDSLPEAYFVDGDEGLKQTTKLKWKGKYIVAEELAVIVPIPDSVVEDSEYDLWAEVKPRLIEAIYKKIDEAVLFGKGKPQSWIEGLIPQIINAGHTITPSSTTLYEQISDALAYVEQDGFDPNGILGGIDLKGDFRKGLVDTTGQPLQASDVTELPRLFVNNGAWNTEAIKFIVGDFKQAVFAIRSDIKFELFNTGVISDANGNIIYNLLQQDMSALRVTFRLGWQLPNPVNALAPDEEGRLPFALTYKTVAPTTYNVTFTVKNGEANVSGAEVTFGGQVKKTNSSGVAVFKSLGASTYLYKVAKTGFNDKFGESTVSSANVAVAVDLAA